MEWYKSLKYYREQAMSQAALAKKLGVTAQTISQWERGLHAPRPVLRRSIVEFLDCEITDIWPKPSGGNWIDGSSHD